MMPKIQVDLEKAAKFKGEEIRRVRDSLLSACDWVMMPDVKTDKDAWTAYRQALRDVTKQTGFPFNVEWPKSPAEG